LDDFCYKNGFFSLIKGFLRIGRSPVYAGPMPCDLAGEPQVGLRFPPVIIFSFSGDQGEREAACEEEIDCVGAVNQGAR